jgi:hypothetical protein
MLRSSRMFQVTSALLGCAIYQALLLVYVPVSADGAELLTVSATSRGLSGYRARRQVADSRRPVFMAGLSLNQIGDRGPTPQPQGVMCGLP